ncbi:unnamed protein product, partial [Symbiodinium necroappetens]
MLSIVLNLVQRVDWILLTPWIDVDLSSAASRALEGARRLLLGDYGSPVSTLGPALLACFFPGVLMLLLLGSIVSLGGTAICYCSVAQKSSSGQQLSISICHCPLHTISRTAYAIGFVVTRRLWRRPWGIHPQAQGLRLFPPLRQALMLPLILLSMLLSMYMQGQGQGQPQRPMCAMTTAKLEKLGRLLRLLPQGLDHDPGGAQGSDLADDAGGEEHPGAAAPCTLAELVSGPGQQQQQLCLTHPFRKDLHHLLRQLPIWNFHLSPLMTRGTLRSYPGWPQFGQLQKFFVLRGVQPDRLPQLPRIILWTAFLKQLKEERKRSTLMARTLLPQISDQADFPRQGPPLEVSATCPVMRELATARNPKTEEHSSGSGAYGHKLGDDFQARRRAIAKAWRGSIWLLFLVFLFSFGETSWAIPIFVQCCFAAHGQEAILQELHRGFGDSASEWEDELMSLAQAHGLCFLNTWTRHVLYAFRAWALFQRSYRELRRQGKQQRKQLLINKLQQASQAADRKDIRALYQIIKQISAKQQRGKARIRTVDGELLEPLAEHAEISSYFHRLFGTDQSDIIPTDRLQPVIFEQEEIESSLQQLGTGAQLALDMTTAFDKLPRQSLADSLAWAEALPSSKGQGMGKGPTRSRWGGWRSSKEWSSTSATENNRLEEKMRLLARVALRHEDELSQMRTERVFVLTFETKQGSVLNRLYELAVIWHEKKEKEEVTSPLRLMLFMGLLEHWKIRLRALEADQNLRDLMVERGLATLEEGVPELKWGYQKWNSTLEKLETISDAEPMLQLQVVETLIQLEGDSITFLVGVGLRDPMASQAWGMMTNLCGLR